MNNEIGQQRVIELQHGVERLIRSLINRESIRIIPHVDVAVYDIIKTHQEDDEQVHSLIKDALTFRNNSELNLASVNKLYTVVNKSVFSRMAYLEVLNTHYFVPILPPETYNDQIVTLDTVDTDTDHKWKSFFGNGVDEIITHVEDKATVFTYDLVELALTSESFQSTGYCNLIDEEVNQYGPYLTTATAVDRINFCMQPFKMKFIYLSGDDGGIVHNTLCIKLIP